MPTDRIIYTAVFLILSLTSYTQNPKSLQPDNGFSIFHFGDTPEKYGESIKYLAVSDSMIKYCYVANDSAVKKIDTIYFDNILLNFNLNNKLESFVYSIIRGNNSHSFVKSTKQLFENLTKYFIVLYGDNYADISNDENGIPGFEWKLNKMKIKISMYSGANNAWRRIDVFFCEIKV